MPELTFAVRLSGLIAVSILAVVAAGARADGGLNVLFIATDDMNCDLSAYGQSQVKSPQLERLAKLGVRFDNAYCQQPLCGPSRASVMTGLRPDTLDMHTLAHELRQKNPDVVTLGQAFRNAEYFSARVGKIYHYGNPRQIGTDGNDDPATWDERYNPAGIDKLQEDRITCYSKGGLGCSMSWWDPVSEDIDHTDGLVADQSIALINANRNRPFFIAAGFYNPHCPYVAPRKYFEWYPLESIPLQDLASAKGDLEDVPPMATHWDNAGGWPYRFGGITRDQARRCKQAYYACSSFVDAQVGKLIDALESNGLLDRTIIVFWSDHGYFLGEKGLWYKRKAFERASRVPLIVAGPGVERGTNVEKPVELLDLYPTLCDLCNVPMPDELEGQSLRPLLEQPEHAEWTKPAVTQVWHGPRAWGYSIRTKRWRYTEWLSGEAGRELYDHSVDSGEVTNLAEDPQHAGTVELLSGQLSEFTKQAVAFEKPLSHR